MEFVMWMLTGGALGWAGYSYLGLNQDRGLVVSAIIGAVGGMLGGKLIAPMFTAGALTPGEFSMPALLFAAAAASALLAAGNVIHKRWGV